MESAQGPNPSFFYLTFIQLGSLLGPGFGPGLDNSLMSSCCSRVSSVLAYPQGFPEDVICIPLLEESVVLHIGDSVRGSVCPECSCS